MSPFARLCPAADIDRSLDIFGGTGVSFVELVKVDKEAMAASNHQ